MGSAAIKNIYLVLILIGSLLSGINYADSVTNNNNSVNDNPDNIGYILSYKKLIELADSYYQLNVDMYQAYVYFEDLKTIRQNKYIDNTPEGLIKFKNTEDTLYKKLKEISPDKLRTVKEKVFYAKFLEALEASIGQRICNSQYWNINHVSGAHTTFSYLLETQPLNTALQRQDTLKRWKDISRYYRQEIENLKEGLSRGYSVPKRVVMRVARQLDNFLASANKDSFKPFINRTKNKQFKKDFLELVNHQVIPTLEAYNNFLTTEYLPKARNSLGIHALPEGRKCYMALYRAYTSLDKTPEEIHDLGIQTVYKNEQDVIKLGQVIYDETSFEKIVDLATENRSQRFKTSDEMHNFYIDVVGRSKSKIKNYFKSLPSIELEVKTIADHQQGTGMSAHYIRGNANSNAYFMYDPVSYSLANLGDSEILTVHEGIPGHHMQLAHIEITNQFHPLEQLLSNAAFSEGWARYAEALAEEADIYKTESAKILRRTWPGRGMVADTGLHLLGWTENAVANYIAKSGKSFSKAPAAMLDRIAALPAQLTAYDSGAAEIFSLRSKLQSIHKENFNIKEFHYQILKNGNIPISLLKKKVLGEYLTDKVVQN